MEVQFGPNPVDEPNLLYKLQRKIKVFNTSNPLPNRGYNLVACSSKYGLVFIGVPDGTLSVYYLAQLIDEECDPNHFSVKLQESPTHIAVSCDYELLAVTGGQLLSIYRVTDFQHQNVAPSLTIKTETNPSTFVSALQWNPCIPDSIAIAFHDGTLFACTAGNGQVKKVPSKARCICWSPKGKQLVTGNSDGTLCQYKPDLTPAKLIPAPKLFEGSPIEALAVYWISTYQFSVVFKNAVDNSRPAVTIVTTPKGSPAMCTNFEDICYSMGSNRPWYYYLQGVAQWNIILASSSNSMEIATIGSNDGVNWLQWSQATDETRAELPLTNKTQETYPTGISIDTCAIHQLPWGENETLPFMPLLHVVSQSGLLTIFNIVNLNKQAPQLCSPPQQLALPAAGLTSNVPDDAPPKSEPVSAPVAAPEIKPQPVAPQAQVQPPPPVNQFSGTTVTASATIKIPSFTPSQQTQQVPATITQLPEPKPLETTPVPTPQQIPPVQPKPQVPQKSQQAITQENAALKAEQERINKMKANQELKNMLIKEVNDFQMELYNFMVKTRETQARIQRDIDSINSNFSFNSLDTEQFKKDCSIEDLRSAVVQLKLELVRACAVVAEARTHSDAKDFHEWTQADPLTTKRVASVKKLAYYVQTQLDQAHKALDYKWNELASKDPQYKGEPRMIRPILDDVYQPLVKQQEILSRQQAVLRTLRKTLSECEIGPVFKSTSLLRSTPFKKDPLSKLTKNILNMSIEPKSPKPNQSLLTPQKLDALRDALSNHKTTKIKPVNVELRQHLANLRINYERSLREKAVPTVPVKVEAEVKPAPAPVKLEPPVAIKLEPKPEPKFEPMKQAVPKMEPKQVNQAVPAFAPVTVKPAVANVARTLFTEEPKQEPPKPALSFPPSFKPTPTQPITQNASPTTKSVLKDLLQNKSQANIESKNDATFMGQKICSPTAFAQSPTTAPTPSSSMFTSKPIAEITNMFNKFQPQAFVPEKPISNIKSSETGEPEATDTPKPFEFKPTSNIFGMKNTTPVNTASNVPDVLKTSIPDKKIEGKVTVKPLDKLAQSKENVPETGEAKIAQTIEKKEVAKPFGVQGTNKSFVFGSSVSSNIPSNDKPIELKTEVVSAESSKTVSNSSSTSSITASESKSSDVSKASVKSETPTSSPSVASAGSKSSTPTQPSSDTSINASESEQPVGTPKSDASSIFSAAVASQPKTTSIFSSTGSVFGTTTTASVFQTTTKASPFSGGSLFSTATSSVFGQSSPTTVTTDQASSIFASAVSTAPSFGTTTSDTVSTASVTATAASVFGSTSATFATATTSTPAFGTTASSVFGTPTVTTASVFATTTTPSAFAPTTSSIFGTATTTASIFSSSTSQPSVFGQATPVFGSATTQASIFGSTQSSPVSVFGQAAQGSLFGTSPTTQASVFGTPTQTTQASVFGTQTTQASVFNTPTQTTQASVFGTQTTQAPVFGTPTPTTQASVFGTPPQSTQASVFGTPPQTTQASVFGTPPQTTQASVFGTPPQTTQASVFGSPTQTTQPSVFGAPTPTTQASVFGTPPQTTQASVFGTPPQGTPASVFGTTTTTQSGSLFGGTENLFAAASISTTNAPTQSSGGSIFGGGSASSGSVFGGTGTNVFGGKTTFGQPDATAASIFGGGGATAFGDQSQQKQFFWGSGNNNTSGFGSSAFGQPATTQSSIFGGTTGGSFTASSAGAFGSPQGSFGSGSPKPSVFGSPQQQTSPAFGGSPSFGSKPLFGQAPGFGSPTAGGFGAPAFGGFNKSPSSAGFGGPASFGGGSAFGGQAFGNTSPGKINTLGFGSPTQSNATFESLATQNTMTFGNLAQQSGQPQQQSPSFSASPSFTEWRG